MDNLPPTNAIITDAFALGQTARKQGLAIDRCPYDGDLRPWWVRGWRLQDAELRAEALEALPHQVGLLLYKGLAAARELMTEDARAHMRTLLHSE